ncbi:hypothetical protein HG531_011501 [Fusarium graminearum]|nr:hypothetical protein HG531_011501 [Fusarium graminearum]
MRAVKTCVNSLAGDLAAFLLLELRELNLQLFLQVGNLVLMFLDLSNHGLVSVLRLLLIQSLVDLVQECSHHLGVRRLLLLVGVNSLRWYWGLVILGVSSRLHHSLESNLGRVSGGSFRGMSSKRCQEA